jgi:hypothetical protein
LAQTDTTDFAKGKFVDADRDDRVMQLIASTLYRSENRRHV